MYSFCVIHIHESLNDLSFFDFLLLILASLHKIKFYQKENWINEFNVDIAYKDLQCEGQLASPGSQHFTKFAAQALIVALWGTYTFKILSEGKTY